MLHALRKDTIDPYGSFSGAFVRKKSSLTTESASEIVRPNASEIVTESCLLIALHLFLLIFFYYFLVVECVHILFHIFPFRKNLGHLFLLDYLAYRLPRASTVEILQFINIASLIAPFISILGCADIDQIISHKRVAPKLITVKNCKEIKASIFCCSFHVPFHIFSF